MESKESTVDFESQSLPANWEELKPGSGEVAPEMHDANICKLADKIAREQFDIHFGASAPDTIIAFARALLAASQNSINAHVASGEAPKPNAERDYATRLATYLWQHHYSTIAPNWEPFDDLYGVLSQIDNMIVGITRAAVSPSSDIPIDQPDAMLRMKQYIDNKTDDLSDADIKAVYQLAAANHLALATDKPQIGDVRATAIEDAELLDWLEKNKWGFALEPTQYKRAQWSITIKGAPQQSVRASIAAAQSDDREKGKPL
jgi:hypothetical protein